MMRLKAEISGILKMNEGWHSMGGIILPSCLIASMRKKGRSESGA
jgi:hypothetical protein